MFNLHICMYIHIYIYIYIHIDESGFKTTRPHLYLCVAVLFWTTFSYIYIYICVCMYTCMYAFSLVPLYRASVQLDHQYRVVATAASEIKLTVITPYLVRDTAGIREKIDRVIMTPHCIHYILNLSQLFLTQTIRIFSLVTTPIDDDQTIEQPFLVGDILTAVVLEFYYSGK